MADAVLNLPIPDGAVERVYRETLRDEIEGDVYEGTLIYVGELD